MRCLLTSLRREVQPAIADELDGNNDVDRMNDMIVDIGRG
jgi:hypothetical protein